MKNYKFITWFTCKSRRVAVPHGRCSVDLQVFGKLQAHPGNGSVTDTKESPSVSVSDPEDSPPVGATQTFHHLCWSASWMASHSFFPLPNYQHSLLVEPSWQSLLMETRTSRSTSKGCWERGGSAWIPCPPMGAQTFGRHENIKGGWKEAAWAGGAAPAPREVTSPSPESYIMHVACFVPPRVKSSGFTLSHRAGLLLLGSYIYILRIALKPPPHSNDRVEFYFIRSQFVLTEVFLNEAYVFAHVFSLNAFKSQLQPGRQAPAEGFPAGGSGRRLSLKTLPGAERQFGVDKQAPLKPDEKQQTLSWNNDNSRGRRKTCCEQNLCFLNKFGIRAEKKKNQKNSHLCESAH